MDYYSGIAEGYDELYEQEQLEKLNILKQHFTPKPLLLDIGAGTGISTRFFHIEAIALDPSSRLLQKYSGKKACAKAEDMPFDDNSFNSIISITALHHTEIADAVKEIKRVAAPGCNFAFSILKKAKGFEKIVKCLKSNFNLKEYDSKKDLILVSA